MLFDESLMSFFAIDVISHDRVTDRAQVNANLMRAAGLDLHLEQREFTDCFHNGVFRMRRASSVLQCGHACPDSRMSYDRFLYGSTGFCKPAMNQSDVSLLDLSILKRGAQLRMTGIVLCDQEQTRGPFVDAM